MVVYPKGKPAARVWGFSPAGVAGGVAALRAGRGVLPRGKPANAGWWLVEVVRGVVVFADLPAFRLVGKSESWRDRPKGRERAGVMRCERYGGGAGRARTGGGTSWPR